MKPKQERRELQKLYDLIPKFKCIEGCTDCCGPVPASREEKRHAPRLAETAAIIENLVDQNIVNWCSACVYARPGHGCAIYEHRPFICRLFGTSEDPKLQCHHGYHSEKQFTVQQTTDLILRYFRLLSQEDRAEYARMSEAWNKKMAQEPEIREYDVFGVIAK